MLCFISGLIVSPKKTLILWQAQRDKKEALVLSALNLKSLEALNWRETFHQFINRQLKSSLNTYSMNGILGQ